MPSLKKVGVSTGANAKARRVVTHNRWLAARTALLEKEKELTRLHDQLARQRRNLPWELVEKPYTFNAPEGRIAFADLFGRHSQLIVYHFMFAPEWEQACKHCSFWVDHLHATLPHLAARDVALACVSRAPLSKIKPFKKRMGWKFPWVSSLDSDFNYDFQVSFRPEQLQRSLVYYNYRDSKMKASDLPGTSVFYKDKAGRIFHTYSCYARGLEPFNGTYQLLDLVPKGRDEAGLPWSMAWVKYHDEYDV